MGVSGCDRGDISGIARRVWDRFYPARVWIEFHSQRKSSIISFLRTA